MLNIDEQERASVLLGELAVALRDVHQTLLQVEASKAGIVNNPGRLLELATTDERFAWLRRLSALMAVLDEQREDEEWQTMSTVTRYRSAIERLISTSGETSNEIGDQYVAAMQQSPDVVMAHAALRRALGKLPSRSNAEK